MSMLNFYINRAGKSLPQKQKRVLERAKDELRREVSRLAIMAASKLVGKSLDTQDHQRLVDEALSEVERTKGFGKG